MAKTSTGKARGFTATVPGPKPGEFPIGTIQSRAAARMLLDRARQGRERLVVRHSIPDPRHDNTKPHATPWGTLTDGRLMRWVYVPPGMAAEEASRPWSFRA